MKKFGKTAAFILAGALTLTTTGCGNNSGGENSIGETGAEKNDNYVFKIGTVNGSLCYIPLYLAADLGYFDEEFEAAGIQYELVDIGSQELADMVASGQMDACMGLAGALIPQIDNGLEISFTAGIHTGCTKYYVSADSDIKDLSDLKGKKIGVCGMGDSSVVALKRKLNDLGIGVSTNNMEFELVVYNMNDLPLALANGAVDVIAAHDPVATLGEEEYGFRKILDLTEDEKFKDEYCCAAFITTSAIDNHPEAAAAYTRAMMKASAYVQADPENAAKIQSDNNHCSGDLETNAKLLGSYNYEPSVSVMEETYRNACADLLKIGDLKEDRDIDEFTSQHVAKLDGVPDSYIYNNDGTFTALNAGDNVTAEHKSGLEVKTVANWSSQDIDKANGIGGCCN